MIAAVGSEDEKDSPFFLENKKFCEEWDAFIESIGGTFRAKYGAWALVAKGEFQLRNIVLNFTFKKSTSTDSPSGVSRNTKLIFTGFRQEGVGLVLKKKGYFYPLLTLFDKQLTEWNVSQEYFMKFDLKATKRHLFMGLLEKFGDFLVDEGMYELTYRPHDGMKLEFSGLMENSESLLRMMHELSAIEQESKA